MADHKPTTHPGRPNLVLSHATEKTKIRHRNAINLTFSTMRLPAKRVLFLMLAQLDSKKPFGGDVVFRVTAEEYARLCNIKIKSAYEHLRAAVVQLQQQLIEVPKDELLPLIPRRGELREYIAQGKIESNAKIVRMFNVAQWVDYAYDSGFVQISPSRQFEPYVAELSRDYTTQALLSAVRLPDKNAVNMYQFLRQALSSGRHPNFVDITVDGLRRELGLYKEKRYDRPTSYLYPQYSILKRDVINKAIKTINERTELAVSVEVAEKIGRRVDTLRFNYTELKQHNLQF